MKKNTAVILIGLFINLNLFSQSAGYKINELISAYAENGQFNGTILVKKGDKIIYEAEGDPIMDVLLAFAMYSRDEDFDRAVRRAAYLLHPPEYPSRAMLEEMKEVGAV